MTVFSAALRAKMQALNVTQADLAAAADLPKSTISRYVNGISTPRGGHLRRLADTLRCTVDELTGEGPPPDPRFCERDLPVDLTARMMGKPEKYVLDSLEQHPGVIGWINQREEGMRRTPYISPYLVKRIVGDEVYNKEFAEYTGKAPFESL